MLLALGEVGLEGKHTAVLIPQKEQRAVFLSAGDVAHGGAGERREWWGKKERRAQGASDWC